MGYICQQHLNIQYFVLAQWKLLLLIHRHMVTGNKVFVNLQRPGDFLALNMNKGSWNQ